MKYEISRLITFAVRQWPHNLSQMQNVWSYILLFKDGHILREYSQSFFQKAKKKEPVHMEHI